MNNSRLLNVIKILKSDQGLKSFEKKSFEKTKLKSVIDDLSGMIVVEAPVVRVEAIKHWEKYLESGQIAHLSRRDIKQLSWHSDISLTERFIDCLAEKNIKVSKSISKGLIYSLMVKWKFLADTNTKKVIKETIRRDNPDYYMKIEKYLFNENGNRLFADEVFDKQLSVQQHISDNIGITTSNNQFCENVYDHLIQSKYKILLSNDSKKRKWFFDNVLNALTKEQILNCIELVVKVSEVPDEEAKEDLKQFVLFHPHLGDPRLPGFEGNWPKNHKVTNLFIEWLSQSDIKFFFELFIDNRNDVQGRRNFWLKYAHLVKGTRVIVSDRDQSRFARQITEMQQRNNNTSLFAVLKEKSKEATAFMMDFGSVIIVEFSQANNACYIYDKSSSKFPYTSRELFWRTHEFSDAVLRRKSIARDRLTHRDGWEENFENIFIREYGLRPKKS